jgi:hypothetical protein
VDVHVHVHVHVHDASALRSYLFRRYIEQVVGTLTEEALDAAISQISAPTNTGHQSDKVSNYGELLDGWCQ